MERYPITEKDRELIEIGLAVLEKNFDDGIYNLHKSSKNGQ